MEKVPNQGRLSGNFRGNLFPSFGGLPGRFVSSYFPYAFDEISREGGAFGGLPGRLSLKKVTKTRAKGRQQTG